ncbi:hypothetical protein MMC13_000018 [Lambiella insularis]|nr:hypothetical protein [Lambiella insularis]
MNMLENHLQQITLSAEAIAELPFPPPRIFTNALLHPHDITTLIRDTEAHERALFTVAPPNPGCMATSFSLSRKSTVFNTYTNGENAMSTISTHKGLRPTSAVSRILGGDMMKQIESGATKNGRDRNEVDVELLLKGAEKLCSVYPIHGAMDRISSLRTRYEQLTASIERYEAKVGKQALQLERMNKSKHHKDDFYDEEDDHGATVEYQAAYVSTEDLQREEAEMKELERKKRGLEDRVSGYEKDIGGLLR